MSLTPQQELDAAKNQVVQLQTENKALKDEVARLTVPPAPKPVGPPPPFVFSGSVGGPFSITGKGFGVAKGSVIIAGRSVETTRWKNESIKGMVPPDLPRGTVDVVVNGTKVPSQLF